jgi:two-component system CheB/CheR fusion protein
MLRRLTVEGVRLKTRKARRPPGNPRKSSASTPRSRRGAGKEKDGGRFPVVGIGASAGGLDAFLRLFDALPAASGMGYVVIQHMDPSKESLLADILARSVRIPIVEARDRMKVLPDRIHVIPPNTNMGIENGRLSILPRPDRREPHLPVDFFFRLLARDLGEKAIGIVLSGNGSDGSQGVRAIKAEGGITFAQDERSAKYSGMPLSAAASGCVDFVLPPDGIAGELARFAKHSYVATKAEIPVRDRVSETEEDIGRIFLLIRDATGVDFAQYRTTTTRRRILRRMALHKIDDLKSYAGHIREHPGELDALFQDFLINVTSFFRDPGAFDALRTKVFPLLLEGRVPSDVLRIWIPACSTGEEAYSVALSLREAMEGRGASIPFQIFATDIHEPALEVARGGNYPEGIAQDVSRERLRRFFVKTERGYQISKAIRESCIFARQNLAKDPPFSRLHLISCRNALIYMKPPLQKKILSAFHYALNPGGFLALGTSETVGDMADLFDAVDRKFRVYRKKAGTFRSPVEFGSSWNGQDVSPARKRANELAPSLEEIEKEANGIVLARYGPPGVVVNEQLDIVQFRGNTAPFLAPAPGTASLNLVKMAREGLLPDVRMAIRQARTKNAPVRKDVVTIESDASRKEIGLQVIPIKTPSMKDVHYLLLFEEAPPRPALEPGRKRSRKKEGLPKAWAEYHAQIENDLATTKEYLQTVSEEYEATNEELRSANEEIQSSNEELQSTNEELTTAKEELQSTNEELITVNETLANRNAELGQANNDLLNLLGNVNVPVVIVGHDLRIRRFTPPAGKILSLIPTDIGRPIADLRPAIPLHDLARKIREVLETLSVKEEEVPDPDGGCHLVRIKPYRTEDNKIEGAVVALFDVTALKSSQRREGETRIARDIVDTAREPVLVLDGSFKVRFGNRSFYRMFRTTPKQTETRSLFELGNGQWNIPRLRALLEDVLPRKFAFRDFKVASEFPGVGRKEMLLNARRIGGKNREQDMILLAIEETGDRAGGRKPP